MMLLYMCFISLIYAVFTVFVLVFGSSDSVDDNDEVFEIALVVILGFLGGLLLLFWRWYFQKRFKEAIIGSLATALVAGLLIGFLDAMMPPEE